MFQPTRKHLLAALAAASLMTVTTLAVAETAPDEVVLKNGGMVRGTVLAIEPGTSVTIAVPGVEEPRVIPWDEVDEVERGKHGSEDDTPDHARSIERPGYEAPEENEQLEEPTPRVKLHI